MPTPITYILVSDVDETLISNRSLDSTRFSKAFPHLLSPELIEFACRNLDENLNDGLREFTHYNFFYLCTHRFLDGFYSNPFFAEDYDLHTHCLRKAEDAINKRDEVLEDPTTTAEEKAKAMQEKKAWLTYRDSLCDFSETSPDDRFLTNVIENFENTLKSEMKAECKCIAVSTPEDQPGTCGIGFETRIKPFEIRAKSQKKSIVENRKTSNGKSFCANWTQYPSPDATEKQSVLTYHKNSKNEQLLSIFKDISQRFDTQAQYIIDFVDDMELILQNALKLNPNRIPENIVLRVYRADAFERKKISLVGCITGCQPISVAPATVSQQPTVATLLKYSVVGNAAPTSSPAVEPDTASPGVSLT